MPSFRRLDRASLRIRSSPSERQPKTLVAPHGGHGVPGRAFVHDAVICRATAWCIPTLVKVEGVRKGAMERTADPQGTLEREVLELPDCGTSESVLRAVVLEGYGWNVTAVALQPERVPG
jgi:hypothetical protein